MNYTEVDFTVTPVEPWRDILVAELGDIGFDSFEDTAHGVRAYIPSSKFDRAALGRLITLADPGVKVTHTVREIAPRNWNAEWESSFQPVEVGREVRIRAEFHPVVQGFTHEIVITPRMAFGTGHHATTRMMVEAMLPLDLRGKRVCDLGCGTAVLAILAERMGAVAVRAIDNDPQAVANAKENIALNGCQRIAVENGDVGLLGSAGCDAILANIERNTLLRDMLSMCEALAPGGTLLLSGFVVEDRARMLDAITAVGMRPVEDLTIGDWALIGCRK